MKFEPFHLERWLLNPCEYDLASAGITKLKLREVTTDIDYDMILSYGITRGSDTIRQEVADLFTGVGRDNVLVTTGTAEANLLVLYDLLEKDDEFVTISPTYMQCTGLAKSLGAKIKACHLREAAGYKLDVEELKSTVTRKTKIIFVVNPNNPTGSIISESAMHSICDIAEDVGCWVLCDGALRGLEVEDDVASSPVGIYEKGIATGSLSKVGLTGPRIGWILGDEKLLNECWALKDYTTLCHSGIGEYLATIALRRENMSRYLKRAKSIIKAHIEILSTWISENHPVVEWVPSKAGHTGLVKYNLDLGSLELCKGLLEGKKVLVSPGDFFESPKHLRVRYSCDKDTLSEGLRRFAEFLKEIPNCN